jgi:hypothetical protein
MQVSEMYAEYFPPKADIVLEKETSTECYIIVSGAVVSQHILYQSFRQIFEVASEGM